MRPPVLCKLQKGVLLDANEGFVDTFNWMVDFINNLCGDGDLDATKAIKVDKTIDDHPVITSTAGGAVGEGVDLADQKIITGVEWDSSNHKLVISSANANIEGGVITSWTPNEGEDINTVNVIDIAGL